MNSKHVLRSEMKQILSRLSNEEKARQSSAIQERVLNHESYLNANRVSIYLSLKSEVDTSLLLKRILADQKQCYIPRYKNGTRQMEMIRLDSLEEYERLPETNWKIKQHPDDSPKRDAIESGGLDLILLPGFAFSANGARLGKGGGFYDAYLNRLQQSGQRMPRLVGLAFKEQLLDDIPMTETDFRVDEVISG